MAFNWTSCGLWCRYFQASKSVVSGTNHQAVLARVKDEMDEALNKVEICKVLSIPFLPILLNALCASPLEASRRWNEEEMTMAYSSRGLSSPLRNLMNRLGQSSLLWDGQEKTKVEFCTQYSNLGTKADTGSVFAPIGCNDREIRQQTHSRREIRQPLLRSEMIDKDRSVVLGFPHGIEAKYRSRQEHYGRVRY